MAYYLTPTTELTCVWHVLQCVGAEFHMSSETDPKESLAHLLDSGRNIVPQPLPHPLLDSGRNIVPQPLLHPLLDSGRNVVPQPLPHPLWGVGCTCVGIMLNVTQLRKQIKLLELMFERRCIEFTQLFVKDLILQCAVICIILNICLHTAKSQYWLHWAYWLPLFLLLWYHCILLLGFKKSQA